MRTTLLLFRFLNVSALTTHRLRTVLSALGVALGVSLVLGVLIFDNSLTTSFTLITRDLRGGANLEVTTDATAGLDSSLVGQVRSTAGVKLAAPFLLERTAIRGPRGSAQVLAAAYDKESEKLASSLLDSLGVSHLLNHPGVAASESLLSRTGTYPDRTLMVMSHGHETPLGIVTVIRRQSMGQLGGTYLLVMPLDVGQRLYAVRGRISSILVETTDRSPAAVAAVRDELQQTLGPGIQVIPPEQRAMELDRSTEQLRWYATFVSSLALLLGGYLVFNTMSMAVVERQKELAILLVVGDSRLRVLLRFLAEALVIGCLGVAVGLPSGIVLGQYLVAGVPQYLMDAYGYFAQPIVPLWTVFFATAAGLATAVLAALVPAMFILRSLPADVLRQKPVEDPTAHRLLRTLAFIVGIGLIALGILGSQSFPTVGVILNVFVFLGAVLGAPGAFGFLSAVVGRALTRSPFRVGSGILQLSGANLLQNRGRTTATVTATAFSLVMVVAMGELASNVATSVRNYAQAFSRFDLYVSASFDAYQSVLLDPSLADAASADPGVAAVYPRRLNFVGWQGRRILLMGEMPVAIARQSLTFQVGSAATASQGLSSGSMLVSTQIAQRNRLSLGNVVHLNTPSGDRAFSIAGVVEDWSWPEGVMVIDADAFTADFRQSEINQLDVVLSTGASASTVAARLQRLAPGLIVRSGGDYSNQVLRELSAFFEPFFRLRDMLVLVGVLAVFNTILIGVLQRLSELGVLRAVGLFRSQLGALFMVEALAMVLIALLGALVLGVSLHFLGVSSLVATMGLPLRWEPSTGPLLTALVAASVIVVGGSAYPAWRAGNVPVLDAIAYE